MIVTVEISCYPLESGFETTIDSFIEAISQNNIQVEIGRMSTLVTGDYNKVMEVLTSSMGELMEKHPSVFTMKISNTCPL